MSDFKFKSQQKQIRFFSYFFDFPGEKTLLEQLQFNSNFFQIGERIRTREERIQEEQEQRSKEREEAAREKNEDREKKLSTVRAAEECMKEVPLLRHYSPIFDEAFGPAFLQAVNLDISLATKTYSNIIELLKNYLS